MAKPTRVRGSGKSRFVNFRVKETELPELHRHVKSAGHNMSTFIRDLLRRETGLKL